jgi:hypothetical protein
MLISLLEMKHIFWSALIVLLSSVGLHAQIKLKGIDAYNNVRVQITLHPNGSYTLEESYLDGSYWKDEGTWQGDQNQARLFSSKKSKREHNYLRFKPKKKFDGETFELNGETASFSIRSGKGSNKYYKELKWRKSAS